MIQRLPTVTEPVGNARQLDFIRRAFYAAILPTCSQAKRLDRSVRVDWVCVCLCVCSHQLTPAAE